MTAAASGPAGSEGHGGVADSGPAGALNASHLVAGPPLRAGSRKAPSSNTPTRAPPTCCGWLDRLPADALLLARATGLRVGELEKLDGEKPG